MKIIALSASFFNCPPCAEILSRCDVVFSSNPYALENFQHNNKRPISEYNPEEFTNATRFEFPALRRVFSLWCAFTATDSELVEWFQYFGATVPDAIRATARDSIPRGRGYNCHSVPGGWQSQDIETATVFGPIFNNFANLLEWQGENIPRR